MFIAWKIYDTTLVTDVMNNLTQFLSTQVVHALTCLPYSFIQIQPLDHKLFKV